MRKGGSGHRHRAVSLLSLLLIVAVGGMSASAQNPILTLAFEADQLDIVRGASAVIRLHVDNPSVYEADDLEVALLSEGLTMAPIEAIKVLAPFDSVSLDVWLTVPEDSPEGERDVSFEIVHTYCIGDLCFQILEELSLSLNVRTPSDTVVEPITLPIVGPVEPKAPPQWPPIVPIALGIVLVGALMLARRVGRRWWIVLMLMAVVGGGIGLGLRFDQDQQAQSIGAVLCTSCVGIEEAPRNAPTLSDSAREVIQLITEPIELYFFTATWCQACPYAKAMVELVTAIQPKISVRVIDVDEDKETARLHGIVQSERTIVPAIYRVDTDRVLFGIENLETRLIELLEASP